MKCFYVPGTCTIIACGTDETKLVESVCETVLHDWPVKSAIVDLPIRLKEI